MLRKVQFPADFLAGEDFLTELRCACSLGIPVRDPLNLINSRFLQITLLNSTCLRDAPSLHSVDSC